MKKSYTLMVLWALLASFNAFSVPQLNSLPSAQATIYLDFDGQYVSGTVWNGGGTINCAPAVLTDAQIIQVFNRVSEDFRPFNLNITTSEAVYNAAPLNRRVRIIVTPTSA